MEAFTCYLEFTTHGNAVKLVNTMKITPFITSMVSITLVLNTVATCTSHSFFVTPGRNIADPCSPLALIVYKIWSIEHHSRVAFAGTVGGESRRMRRAMHIIIESGFMYTVSVIVLFILYLASNNAQYAVSDCVSLFRFSCQLSSVADLVSLPGGPDHRESTHFLT